MSNTFAEVQLRNRSISLSMRGVNKLLFYVFLFNVVFIPNDTFNIKIISFLLLLLLNIPIIFSAKTKDEVIIFSFGLVLTSITILWSILLTRQTSNVSLGYPGYILLLYFVLKRYRIDMLRSFVVVIKMLAVFVAIMALADMLHIVDMYSNPLLMWFAHSSNAMIGKGDDLPIRIMFFMKTSPLYFVGLSYCLQKKQWLFCMVISFAVVLSGTRANIIMLLAFLAIYFCFFFPSKKFRLFFLIAFIFIGALLLLDGRVIDFFVDMFTRKASSDSTRDGHLRGIIESWKDSPMKLIFGSGYSSEFFSYGLMDMTSSIELSYWNLLRQVGLILFVPMIIMYLYPACVLLRRRRNIIFVLAYFMYLIIAYTNPFLYSSTGLTMLLFMYILCFQKKRKESSVKK